MSLGVPPPADIARLETNRAAAMNSVTGELRQAREMLGRLASDARTVAEIRADLTTLTNQLAGRIAWLEERHLAAIEQWHQALEAHEQTLKIAAEAIKLAARTSRIDDVEPKLDRIDTLINLLDRAHLLGYDLNR